MLSALKRTGALAGFMAGLALTIPVALAERGSDYLVDGLTQNRIWDGAQSVNVLTRRSLSCSQPDASALQAIVPVSTDNGSHASGVVYDINRVLTAAHAVQGDGRFFVRIGDAFSVAELLMVDHVNDLAVLAVDTASIVPLHISGFDAAKSQPVWAVGYPRAQAMMTSSGVVQDNHEGALYASASIDLGQSGGGLLSCQNGAWEILGMLRGYGTYLQGDQYVKLTNHSVSVAAATINEFLRGYR
ncbi:S1 family peptidase [Granulosicoccus antarcticus]|uniref:Serine protease n=1 Tax=Granulosicoccus antarcticus IMCC3135 TaxID=1192854 RepID=A0A2Z2NJB5_9GAMM|nr:serine protease [Granulosicoccus antarcticus]ASJ71269.1 hypothetical protein IMCC3135_05785 [Granulosicoccus antarcticus IMCC3135]